MNILHGWKNFNIAVGLMIFKIILIFMGKFVSLQLKQAIKQWAVRESIEGSYWYLLVDLFERTKWTFHSAKSSWSTRI